MLAAAVAIPVEDVVSRRVHPVPRGARADDSGRLLARSTVLSVALHLGLVGLALVIAYWPSSEIVGTPVEESFDISIVPLSALDTLLPQGAPLPPQPSLTEPAQQEQQPLKSQPDRPKIETREKIVAAKKLAPPQPAKDNSSEARSAQADASSNRASSSQPLGVANGEAISIEQARISYQDMVATMLARAKRYPERAIKRRMTGEGTIRLEIGADGSLEGFQILRSTEAQILDEELKAMVARAAPFPAFPSDLPKSKLALIVPVAFRLES